MGALLVQHAKWIEPLEGGNGGHVIQAAKLAQQQLQVEVRLCLSMLRRADCFQKRHTSCSLYLHHCIKQHSRAMVFASLICVMLGLRMALWTALL